MLRRCFAVVLFFGCIGLSRAQAQVIVQGSAAEYAPRIDAPEVRGSADEFEDALLRHEYERQRMVFPYDHLPEGAYARAARYAHDSMPRFTGGGGLMAVPTWRSIGPDNIGGRINAIAVNPLNPNTIYVGAADGGVWKTYDEGRSWFSVFDNAPTQAMGGLGIDPRDTNVIYAGTGESNFAGDSFFGMGLFKSTNGGLTWSAPADSTFPAFSTVNQVVVDPSNSSIVYATVPYLNGYVEGGLYKSLNAGLTWTRVLKGIVHDVLVNPLAPQKLVASASVITGGLTSTSKGIYRSSDGGATWTHDSLPGVLPTSMGRTTLAQCLAHPEVIYASVSEMSGARLRLLGLFKTTNGGTQWTRVAVPIDFLVPQGFYDNALVVHPVDPNKVIAAGVRIIRTSDGGATWTYVPMSYYNAGVVHPDNHAGWFNTLHPDTVYLCNDGGFFRGTGWGTDWTKRSDGLSITQFTGAAMYPGSDGLYFGGTQDNGTIQSVRSSQLVQTLGGDGGFTAVHPQRPQTIYSEQYGVSMHRSDDLGATWKRITSGIPGTEQALFYAPFTLAHKDGNTMYFGSVTVIKSTDRGDSWKKLINGSCLFSAGLNGCYYVSRLYVSPFNDSLVYAGSSSGAMAWSTNGGVVWKALGSGLPGRFITSIRVASDRTVYVTVDGYGAGHIYKLPPDSTKWKNISGNLPNAPTNDVFVSGDTLVVGTLIGAYISTDGGAAWSIYGVGMPAVDVVELHYNPASGTLRAVTHGRGMYDIAFADILASAPVFRSMPDTTALLASQKFIYAPIVNASPAPVYSAQSTSGTVLVDSVLGIVQWTPTTPQTTITLTARNSAGASSQTFTLHVAHDPVPTDWHVVSSEATGRRTAAIAAIAPSTLWMAHDSALVSRSLDGGQSWTRWTLPDSLGYAPALAALDASTAVVGTWQGNFYRTSDAGATWLRVASYPNTRWENVAFAGSQFGMAVSTGERDTAFVIVTTDGGMTWNPRPSHVYALRPSIHSMFVLDTLHAWFASGNRESSPPGNATVFRTTNGGVSWVASSSHCADIAAMAFVDSASGYAVDRFGGIVDSTGDGGKTWIASKTNPAIGSDMIGVTVIPGTRTVWIVSSAHAWLSYDKGKNWGVTSLVPMGPAVSATFIDSSRGWVAGANNVVQQHDENPMVSVADLLAPRSAGMSEAYPNPFALRTQIAFTLGDVPPVRMRLVIIDGLGRTVRDLTASLQRSESGKIVADFDGNDLPPGAYNAVLQEAEELHRQPLLIVR